MNFGEISRVLWLMLFLPGDGPFVLYSIEI